MGLHELERKLDELRDIEAIKQLKAEYCDVCDDAHDPDRIVGLFTEDCVWEGEGVATARGHAELRALFEDFARRVAFSQHNVFNPRIRIEGDRAWGTWYLLGPFTFREGNRALWVAVRYEEEYVKQGGAWKIRHLRGIGRMAAPYEQGWAGGLDPSVFAGD
ncbi:MAG: nuclear transport factor 2 family protein [Myxococcota bacterium]